MQYPEIYRKRVIGYRQAGHTLKETHEIFQVSIGAIQKWEKRPAETGEVKNKPVKRPFKKRDPEKLKTYIERHPDAYLRRLGFTR